MIIKSILPVACMAVLGACAVPPERAPERAGERSAERSPDRNVERPPERSVERPAFPFRQNGLDATALLGELARVAALSPEQRRRELTGLESERRLDEAQRFQLAALLEREDSVESLDRGLRSLGTLTEIESRARPLIDMMKKSLKARIELKQQSAHAQALQEKLDQIKALEKSLQQRSDPVKTP
jgi:hypothetical protein